MLQYIHSFGKAKVKGIERKFVVSYVNPKSLDSNQTDYLFPMIVMNMKIFKMDVYLFLRQDVGFLVMMLLFQFIIFAISDICQQGYN